MSGDDALPEEVEDHGSHEEAVDDEDEGVVILEVLQQGGNGEIADDAGDDGGDEDVWRRPLHGGRSPRGYWHWINNVFQLVEARKNDCRDGEQEGETGGILPLRSRKRAAVRVVPEREAPGTRAS